MSRTARRTSSHRRSRSRAAPGGSTPRGRCGTSSRRANFEHAHRLRRGGRRRQRAAAVHVARRRHGRPAIGNPLATCRSPRAGAPPRRHLRLRGQDDPPALPPGLRRDRPAPRLAIDDVRVYQPAFDLDVAIAGSGGGYVDSTPAGHRLRQRRRRPSDCSVTRPRRGDAHRASRCRQLVRGLHRGRLLRPGDDLHRDARPGAQRDRDVRSPADAPVAEADAYATQEDTPLSVDAPGVLGNDTDRNGDPLTAALASRPSTAR